MIYVTLILSDNEWSKILNAAAFYWPTQKIDTVMSRQESTRRLLLSGIDQLRSLSPAERQTVTFRLIRTGTRESSSRAGERFSTERPDTFADFPSSNFKPLAVRRGTIPSGKLSSGVLRR